MPSDDITIVSTNLNQNILNNYQDYTVIDSNFTMKEILQAKKLIFYNILSNLEEEKVKEIFQELNSAHIPFINVTNNIEEVMLTSYLIIYDNEKVLIEGPTILVLEQEKLLKRIGLTLPFYVHLSLLLKDYGLVDKIYLNKKELKDALWK